MHFWSGEKYALLGRRKICTFGPAKNMCFWSGEKYALLVRLAKKKQSPAEKKKDLFGGYWLLAIGHWLVASGYWLLAVGYWLLAIGYQPRASHLRRWQERSVARTPRQIIPQWQNYKQAPEIRRPQRNGAAYLINIR